MGSFSVSYVGGEKRTKILIDINKFLFTELAVMLCSYSLFPRKAFLFATPIYKLRLDIFYSEKL